MLILQKTFYLAFRGAKEITPEDIASANQAALQAAKDEVEEQRKKSADIIITAVDDTSAKLIQVFIDGGGIIAKKIKEAIESTTIKNRYDCSRKSRKALLVYLKTKKPLKIPVNKVDPIATGNEVLDQLTGKPSPVPEAVSEAIENSSSKNEASKVSILNTETKTKVAEDLKRVLEEGGIVSAEKL